MSDGIDNDSDPDLDAEDVDAEDVDADACDEAEAVTPPAEALSRLTGLLEGNLGFRRAAEKVRQFPQEPGVYLMKDASGLVIYVGKAKNLRSRAGVIFMLPPQPRCEPPTGFMRLRTSIAWCARAKSKPCSPKTG
jgi:hypothetical protein